MDEDNPELYVGFGPKSLEHAGRVYDGAHLHTFMSDQALANAVGQVRAGEVSAGRKPGTVKVWSVLATACDVSEEKYLKYIVARLATYLQIPGYGDKLVEINGWNPDTLRSFRSHTAVTSVGGAIDSEATTAQIAAIAKLIPRNGGRPTSARPRSAPNLWWPIHAGAEEYHPREHSGRVRPSTP